jgi:hypothetical protein
MLKSEVIPKWWWVGFKDNLKHKKLEWPDIWKRCADSNLISKDEEIEASKRQIIILTEPSIAPRANVMEANPTPDEPEWAIEILQFLRKWVVA